jgi:TRAP-type mannitol/chloroaromatic compound transport system permease small subunit
MIDLVHAFGLWLGGVRLLGLSLPLWALLLVAALLIASPRLLDRLQRGLGGLLAAQEAMLWLHALVFMLGAAYTLKCDGHVRVDILHARLSKRSQARIEAFGQLCLLLPFALFMLWISLDYVAASWAMQESSREPAGLPGVFLLKALIPLAAWLLVVQGLALAITSLKAGFGAESRA